jgi:GR25 family glycosyltransferase involved in LPS biosynthesis
VLIYVINLDRRRDRLDRISADLRSHGLDFDRIRALDGSTLNPAPGDLVWPSMRACWNSHQTALRRICEADADFGLVLEDDAVLSSDIAWPVFLGALDRQMPQENLHFLQLGFLKSQYSRRRMPQWLDERNQVRRLETLEFGSDTKREIAGLWDIRAGAQAYVISRSFASACASLNEPTWLPPDGFYEFMARSQNIFGKYRMARLIKSRVSQWSRPDGGPVTDTDISGYFTSQRSSLQILNGHDPIDQQPG